MDSNEMKLAWQELNRRLDRQEAVISGQLQMTQLKRARFALWPLFAGQLLQILFGIAFILLGTATWRLDAGIPHILVSGVVMHVYGVVLIILAGVLLGRMQKIDYSAPVTSIQLQLAGLRVLYIRCGMGAGLPWWVLWVPFSIAMSAAIFGVDMYARMPLALNVAIAFGFVGLLGTWVFHRWSLHPSRAGLRARLDDNATGSALRKARACVDEIAAFEKE